MAVVTVVTVVAFQAGWQAAESRGEVGTRHWERRTGALGMGRAAKYLARVRCGV